jgi:hypothetical protein
MKISCPNPVCHQHLSGPKSFIGKKVVCPGCGRDFIWSDRFHAGDTFIIYDLETTGLYPDEDEFIQIAVVGALFATLFLGGYNLPYMTDAGFSFPGGTEIALSQAVRVPLQLVTFLGKVALLCSFQILIRWSLPRFRYDQVLKFAWKFMLPLALVNLVVTVVWMWARHG